MSHEATTLRGFTHVPFCLCRRETSHMPPISSLPAGAQKVHRNQNKSIAHEHGHKRSRFNNSICSNTDLGVAVIAWSPVGEVGLVSSRAPSQQSSASPSRREG